MDRVGDFAGQVAVLGRVEKAFANLGVRDYLQRVKHAELHPGGEWARDGHVYVAL
jgi:hypothetical protein